MHPRVASMSATDVLDQSGTASTRFAKSPNLEPIPGYRLLEPLGKGGFGEVWKCEAPGGLVKAVKFVQAAEDDCLHRERCNAEQELRSFNLIKTIRHPYILSVDRVE